MAYKLKHDAIQNSEKLVPIPAQMLTNARREMSASNGRYILHTKTCRKSAKGDREEQYP